MDANSSKTKFKTSEGTNGNKEIINKDNKEGTVSLPSRHLSQIIPSQADIQNNNSNSGNQNLSQNQTPYKIISILHQSKHNTLYKAEPLNEIINFNSSVISSTNLSSKHLVNKIEIIQLLNHLGEKEPPIVEEKKPLKKGEKEASEKPNITYETIKALAIEKYLNLVANLEKNFFVLPIQFTKLSETQITLVSNSTPNQLKDLLISNPKGLDMNLMISITFQLLKAIKFFNRKGLTCYKIDVSTIAVTVQRIKETMIGYDDPLLFLSSNQNPLSNEIHLKVQITDLSKLRSNAKKEIVIIEDKNKKQVPKDLLKQKKGGFDKKGDKKGGDKNDKSETLFSHPLIEELKADIFYSFYENTAPELLIRNILKDEDDIQPPGNEIDVWAIGCVLAEMIDGNKLFPNATNDYDLLWYITKLCPSKYWETINPKFNEVGLQLDKENFNTLAVNDQNNSKTDLGLDLKTRFLGKGNKQCIDLLEKMLDPNPKTRLTVLECLSHPFLAPHFEVDVVSTEYKKCSTLPNKQMKLIESKKAKLSKTELDMLTLKNLILDKEEWKLAKGIVETGGK